jgi:hypothetical protein
VWLKVAPKKFFGAFRRVVMAASFGLQEAQPQFSPTPGLVQIAPQSITDQGRDRELFSLGQKAQLTVRAFFKK